MTQQASPYNYYPPPYQNGGNLAKSHIPTLLVVALMVAVAGAAAAGVNLYRDNKDEQKTLGQRIDGVEKRLDEQGKTLTSIDGTLKRIARGSWTAEVQPGR